MPAVSLGQSNTIASKLLNLNEINDNLINASKWNNSLEEQCVKDISLWQEGIKESKIWSYKMIDSSTKIPVGLLNGNFMDLGNFDECLNVLSDEGNIAGKHCLASFSFSNVSQEVPNFLWSYCIPSSCSANSLQSVLNNAATGLGASVSVLEKDCQINETKKLLPADIFSIVFFTTMLCLCVASTIYDLCWRNMKKNELLISFSIYTNGKRLLDASVTSATLRPLHGIRFLTMAWIILGHRYFYMVDSPIMNSIIIPEVVRRVDITFITGAVVSVDTFFVISGLLNAYQLLQVLRTTGKFPAVKFYLHRYLRTTPALAAVVLMFTTWYSLIGSGPLWYRVTDINKQLCTDYWWPTLLYINNYYNPISQCAGQSWFLAVDMQLYWLSPLVVLPCWKWPKLTKAYLGSLLVLSTVSIYAVTYVNEFKLPFGLLADVETSLKLTRLIYVPTHARATPYIIGLMVGFFLDSNRKSSHIPAISKFVAIIGWMLSVGLCLSAILGVHPFMQTEADHPYNAVESSFYAALFRIAWGCGISWIIIACIYDVGGPVNAFLSWPTFVPLSRLTYCLFLCHMAVQQYQIGTERTNTNFDGFNQVHRYFGDLCLAIIASSLLCLVFESPVAMIEKYFQRKFHKSKTDDGELKNVESKN